MSYPPFTKADLAQASDLLAKGPRYSDPSLQRDMERSLATLIGDENRSRAHRGAALFGKRAACIDGVVLTDAEADSLRALAA